MAWRPTTQGDVLRLILTVFLVICFAWSVVGGWQASDREGVNLVYPIVGSALLWFGAALLGMWRPSSRHISSTLNSFAASMAAFAGLAALHGLHLT